MEVASCVTSHPPAIVNSLCKRNELKAGLWVDVHVFLQFQNVPDDVDSIFDQRGTGEKFANRNRTFYNQVNIKR